MALTVGKGSLRNWEADRFRSERGTALLPVFCGSAHDTSQIGAAGRALGTPLREARIAHSVGNFIWWRLLEPHVRRRAYLLNKVSCWWLVTYLRQARSGVCVATVPGTVLQASGAEREAMDIQLHEAASRKPCPTVHRYLAPARMRFTDSPRRAMASANAMHIKCAVMKPAR